MRAKKAQADFQGQAEALYERGVASRKAGDLRSAYEDFKEASRLDPGIKYWQAYDEVHQGLEAELTAEQASEATRAAAAAAARTMMERRTIRQQSKRWSVIDAGRMSMDGSASPLSCQEPRSAPSRPRMTQRMTMAATSASNSNSGSSAGIRFSGSRMYVTACLVTWGMVIFHYRFDSNAGDMDWREVCACVCVLCVLPGLIWWCVRRWCGHWNQQIEISLSDAIKICSILVILLNVAFHYYHKCRGKPGSDEDTIQHTGQAQVVREAGPADGVRTGHAATPSPSLLVKEAIFH